MYLPIGYILKDSYQIAEVLGHGGFGITYLAKNLSDDSPLCIKEFFIGSFCSRESQMSHVSAISVGAKENFERYKKKFIKEAHTIARLDHPHIIRILDIFEANGTAYYAMTYASGGSLQSIIDKEGPMIPEKALCYIRQIASALEFIHSKDINHLDVKPGNIMLNGQGNALLIDFGLAKQYDATGEQTSSTPVGISAGYAALEQYKSGGVSTFSPTTDIYALAATLYALLTGTPPPNASDIVEFGITFPKQMPENIKNAISKAMAPNRKDRPQTIAEFQCYLEGKAVKSSEETELLTDSPKEVKVKRSFVKPVVITIGVIALILLLPLFLYKQGGDITSLYDNDSIVSEDLYSERGQPSEELDVLLQKARMADNSETEKMGWKQDSIIRTDECVNYYVTLSGEMASMFRQGKMNQKKMKENVLVTLKTDPSSVRLRELLSSLGLSMNYHFTVGKKTIDVIIKPDELSQIQTVSGGKDELVRQQIRLNAENISANCPQEIEDGVIMTKAYYHDNIFCYQYKIVEDDSFTMDDFYDNAENWAESIKDQFSTDLVGTMVKLCASVDTDICFVYIGDVSKRKLTFTYHTKTKTITYDYK